MSKDTLVLSQQFQYHNNLKTTAVSNMLYLKKKDNKNLRGFWLLFVFINIKNTSLIEQQIPKAEKVITGPHF